MARRLAINGFGRIGRCVLRALYERGLQERLPVIAINEPAAAEAIAYLTRYDSTHGRFPGSVELDGHTLVVNGETPDLVELYNSGASVFDLSGKGLTDDPSNRHKFTFPPGTVVPPASMSPKPSRSRVIVPCLPSTTSLSPLTSPVPALPAGGQWL